MPGNYGCPPPLSPCAVDVTLAWLGLPSDHECRTEIEVLIAEGCGWGAIRRHFWEIRREDGRGPRGSAESIEGRNGARTFPATDRSGGESDILGLLARGDRSNPGAITAFHGTELNLGGKMSVKITVRNFRGLKALDASASPLLLAVGTNAQGKSSLCQAVAACLTGRAIEDSFELRKSDIKDLIRDGSTVATVDIVTDKGAAKMVYPDAKLSTTGDAPRASVFAVGLLSIPTMPLKERATALAPYMSADPGLDDLKSALSGEFDDETIGRCWDVIKRDGWDATSKNLEERRARARASWEQVAGESFGSNKAKAWRPEGWSDDLLGDVTAEALTRRRDEARAAVEQAIGSAAVETADLGKLRDLAGEADARRLVLDEAKNAIGELEREKASVDELLSKAPVPANFVPLLCPHCEGKIRVRNVPGKPQETTLEKAEPISDNENRQRRETVAGLEGKQSNVIGRLTSAQGALRIAEQRNSEAQDAVTKLAASEARDENAEKAAEEARAALQIAETDLLRFERKQNAEAAYQRWDANDKFCAVLGPGPQGLRAKKLAEATMLFNSQTLLPLCNAAGWDKVEITEDFRVTLGGRIFSLLSDSDQMRARIILQVAMAKIDRSSMVIIDRAEALDAANKKKLMTLLIDCGVPALVAMVVPNPAAVPDLKKAGFGETWWVSGGEARSLAAVA